MRNRIERLRLYLAISAGLLLIVLIGFIGTARYLKRHALARLESRLGIDIRSEANGFTVSQSLQGRTIYTLHAAKEIEHANGVIGLHDVSMIIYGRTGDRADRVSGNEFEYDKNAGEVRAIGLVHIDVGGAGSGTPGSPAEQQLLSQSHDDPTQGSRVLHATTSGLVYLNKLGVAATKEPIDFETGQMKGHAVGADYNTDSGTLSLHSAVNVSGVSNGRSINITAAAAQLDNRGQRAVLSHAHCFTMDESMDASQVILHTRPDSSLERVEAEGNVRVLQHGAELDSAHADLQLNTRNKPQHTTFTGNVRYTRDEPLRQARGEAQKVEVAFDSEGSPVHATFTTAVHMIERSRAAEDPRQPWAVRDLTANTLESSLVATTPGHSELREAEANGNAHLTLVDNGSSAGHHGGGTTALAGDTLTAHLLPPTAPRQPPHLDTLTAHGHTLVHQLSPEGLDQTSTGDTLNARFRSAAPTTASKPQPSSASEELASAVQTGHVHVTRKAPPKNSITKPGTAPTPEEPQDATADRAAYDGDTHRLTLTGSVRLQQANSLLLANELSLDLDRNTGDAHAEGAVRVSYIVPASDTQITDASSANRDPIHILADRADLKHATDSATFFGRPARLWQGGSQIQAPVLELSRSRRTLAAHGDPEVHPAGMTPVQTILVTSPAAAAHTGAAASPKPDAPKSPVPKTPQTVRILSHDLLYSDPDRKAQFNGSVQIESNGETIRSRNATAYLQPVAAKASATTADQPATIPSGVPVSLDGRIDHVIATGDVVVEQPGRRATGSRLLYSAQDSSVLLTGDRTAPPHVIDTDRGTSVTALAFRLHVDDDSFEALSSLPDDSAHQPVRTETPARH